MKEKTLVLVVEDDEAMRETCVLLLGRAGYFVEAVDNGEAAIARVQTGPPVHIVVVDVRLPKKDGLSVLSAIRLTHPEVSVVIMTGHATIENAIQAMKLGASDYVVKPFEREEFLKVIEHQVRVRELERKVESLRSELVGRYCAENIVGRSKPMEIVMDRVAAAAGSRANVLILGESGTGKELVARAIHYSGRSKEGPFVAVNCAALPEPLVESELFGHAKGAFTGAIVESPGLFRAAHGGTILLDEVFEMPLETQVKLIRVIQERKVRPVGHTAEVEIDVRIIAATNRDPTVLLETGGLRKDLYYRLSVINIRTPALRERPEDIPALANHFRTRFARTYGFAIGPIEPSVMECLQRYSWPGNIREFENLVEQWFAMDRRQPITVEDLPEGITRMARSAAAARDQGELAAMPLHEAERTLALRALDMADQNKSKAANMLGISRKKLYRLLRDTEDTEE
ncbi:MAG: sigma-54 dependent transcriptional regulator [Candidatus Eisenbacteria bacterium]